MSRLPIARTSSAWRDKKRVEVRKLELANPTLDLVQRTANSRSAQKVQVAARFRTASTGSVPFLYHVHPLVQLFSHSHRANFKRKPKYEMAIKIARFPPPPGAPAANPRSCSRCSRVVAHRSRSAALSLLITGHSPPPKSIASLCRIFPGYATLSRSSRNCRRATLLTTHESLLTHHTAPNRPRPANINLVDTAPYRRIIMCLAW
jgi:hypothetical protein